jgi:hypothetical protein
VFGSPNLVSDDKVPIPCLHVPSHKRPSAHAAAASLEDSDDKVPIPHFPPRSALVLCDSDDEVLIPRPMLSCPSSTSRPFARPQPARRLMAVADALLGMVNIDLLLLPPHLLLPADTVYCSSGFSERWYRL